MLEQEGYIVIRAAGSHSPADLVAVGPDKVRFLQIKSTINPKSVKRMERQGAQEIASLPVPPGCVREVWVALRGKGFVVQREV